MPRRRFNRKKAPRRRPYRRIRRQHRRLANRVPTGAAPVARKHIVKLKYVDIIPWAVSAGATAGQSFNMNSIFDPDQTGGGHQPYGYDQLAALFAHYRVFRLKWHIEFAPTNDRAHICVIPINGATVGSTIPELGEQPLAVTKAMSFSGGYPCKFSGSMSLPRLTGATSVQYRTDDRYSAAIGASPVEIMRLNMYVYNPNSIAIDTSCNVTLMYYTEFYDPITLGQS